MNRHIHENYYISNSFQGYALNSTPGTKCYHVLPNCKGFAETSSRITVCMPIRYPPPWASADVPASFPLEVHFHGLNLSGYFHLVPRTFRLTNLGLTSTRQYTTSRPYFVTIRWFLGTSQKSIEPFPWIVGLKGRRQQCSLSPQSPPLSLQFMLFYLLRLFLMPLPSHQVPDAFFTQLHRTDAWGFRNTPEPTCEDCVYPSKKLTLQESCPYIHAFYYNKPSFGTFWTLKILFLHPDLLLQAWSLHAGASVTSFLGKNAAWKPWRYF